MALTPLAFAAAYSLTVYPWYARIGLVLFGFMTAVFPFDDRVQGNLLGFGFSFHHIFELPAMLFIGVYAGHDFPWRQYWPYFIGLVLLILLNDYYYQKRKFHRQDWRGEFLSLGLVLLPGLVGFLAGILTSYYG